MSTALPRRIIIASVAAAMTVTLPSGAHAESQAPSAVHFALSGIFPSPNPVDDVTKGIGAFAKIDKEFNTSVIVTPMAAGPTAMSALLGGSIDYLVCSGNAFARAASIGQPIVAIIELSRGTGGALLAPKKYESRGVGLEALKQWNGATWGMASAGGIAEYHARRAAEDAGLDWKKQNVIYTGSLNATAAGVISRRLDIGEADYWTTALLVSRGEAYVVVNEAKDLTNDRPYSEQLDWVLVARKDTIEKYPGLTQAIVEAELRGLRKVQSLKGNPSGALAIYPHPKTGSLPAKPFATYWSLNEPTVDGVTGFITPEAIEATDTVLRQMNVFKDGQKTPADAYTNRFVQAAYAALKLPEPK